MDASPARHQVSLLPGATVALRFTGIALSGHGRSGNGPMSRVGLELMQRLTAGPVDRDAVTEAAAAAAGVPVAEAATALAELDTRQLLTTKTDDIRGLGDRPDQPERDVATLTDEDMVVLVLPQVLRPTPDGFVGLDHLGRRTVVLSPAEAMAASAFSKATSIPAARAAQAANGGGLDDAAFDELVRRLQAHELLRTAVNDPGAQHTERSQDAMRKAVGHMMALRRAVDRTLAQLDEAEVEVEASTGIRRIPVIPQHNQGRYMPLGLGMILSGLQAEQSEVIARHYQIRPDWSAGDRDVAELAERPSVHLFSNYLWSHAKNLVRSREIKAASPASLMIHGGPDTPKYDADVEVYLRENPHVDIAAHGEGEVVVGEILEALAGTLGDGPPDLSPLRDVAGISFELDGEIVHTASRERLKDLNVIPSPFLSGVFDPYLGVPGLNVVLETNRGCPYGCTYCDWGTATMARIRKFDIDRIMGELQWCADAKAETIALADANFGIFERDVDIAARVVELRAEHGFPIACSGSYAKNTVKHLEKIIGMWVDSGMLTLGVLSLQTMDPDTLDAVRRSNIKTEKYDLLARQFRERNLPLYVDLMLGLPGGTVESFIEDLQSCIDREVLAKIHETVLLPNSPMNEPGYREEHGIQIRRKGSFGSAERDAVVVATSSMDVSQLDYAQQLKPLYLLAENFGVLRHVARYLRHETGRREVELYTHIIALVTEQPERWPALDYLASSGQYLMAPPVSWPLLYEEVREVLVNDFGVADDAALDTTLAVQQAVLPCSGRPTHLELELVHDYAAWHEQIVQCKLDVTDWTANVAPLRTFGPATFVADDPLRLSDQILGATLGAAWFDSWELESTVARPSVLSGSRLASEAGAEPAPV